MTAQTIFGQPAHRHPNGGGRVADTARLTSPSAYALAPFSNEVSYDVS
jgi:hypothetical protein